MLYKNAVYYILQCAAGKKQNLQSGICFFINGLIFVEWEIFFFFFSRNSGALRSRPLDVAFVLSITGRAVTVPAMRVTVAAAAVVVVVWATEATATEVVMVPDCGGRRWH